MHSSGMFLPIYSQDYVIALSSFLNDLQHKLESKLCGTLFQRSPPNPDVVILLYNRLDEASMMVQEACETFAQKSDVSFRLGCSPPMPFVEGIDEAWARAIDASDAIEWDAAELLRRWQADTPHHSIRYHHKYAQEICSALLVSDKSAFDTALDAWFHAQTHGMPHTRGTMRALQNALIGLCEQDCKSRGLDIENFSISFSEYCSATWDDAIEQIKANASCQLWELVATKAEKNSWIKNIAEYLELNYAQKFSQQKCADLFHVNKDYMSRHFREIYGIGMISYLTEIRLRKAKELLCTSDLQIQEIADQVGFFDVKYFSTQFKKETGLSPSSFRMLCSENKSSDSSSR